MYRQVAAASLLALCLTRTALADEWPQFRGPNGKASADAAHLPIAWTDQQNVRWKAELPGRGLSSPVIHSGRVYVTANSGRELERLHVLCFNLADGKKLWERQLWATGSTACHPKTCMAAPTPAVDADGVYALFATGDLVAYDHDGRLLWYRALCQDYPTITNQVGMAASPIVWRETLLLPMENGGDSFVAGLDKRTGTNRWRNPRPRDINWVTPLIYQQGDQTDVLFQTAGEITAYDVESGRKRWTHEGKGLSSVASPVLAEGMIIVAGNDSTALRPSTGDSPPEVKWQSNRLRTGYTSFAYHEGCVYGVLSNAVLNCVDVNDGKLLWSQRLKGAFSSSPVVVGNRVYVANEEGTTFVVETGKEPKLLASNAIGEAILATPAIANDSIFLRTDNHLYRIGGN